ncbi:MAG: phytanoyl-CoA dioxygenase family protein [Chthonomonadaceae bacterium]|nr:phytanoyl-CoA dioxygenase family protein [Chthonomonadaceae bacterium]
MSYTLTDEQLAFYAENGYLVVKGLLNKEEAAHYRAETHALADRLMAKKTEMNAAWKSGQEAVKGSQGTVIYHCHDVQFQSAEYGKLLMDSRLTDVAADLIGSPNVELHHTKMFIKPPEKGAPFPMHQDAPYFPHDKHSMIAVILHFDDAPIEKGCVRVVPGTHKLGMLPHDKEGGWHLPFSEYPVESAVPCEAEAGDALFFSYLTVHGSGVNVSQEARTTLLIQMRDPEDKPSVETHLSRGQGTMLRGFNPG